MAEKKVGIRTLVADSTKQNNYVCRLIEVKKSIADQSIKYTLLITSPKKVFATVRIPKDKTDIINFLNSRVKTTGVVDFTLATTDTLLEIHKDIQDLRTEAITDDNGDDKGLKTKKDNSKYYDTFTNNVDIINILGDLKKDFSLPNDYPRSTDLFGGNFAIIDKIKFDETYKLQNVITKSRATGVGGGGNGQSALKTELDKVLQNGSHIEDQAFLLLNLDKFNVKNTNVEEFKNINKSYKNLIRVDVENKEENHYFINRLFNPPDLNRFMSASPLLLSALTPKIRLYKVIQKDNNDLIINDEDHSFYTFLVPFEQYFSANTQKILMQEYGKSYGTGLKSVKINDASGPQTPTNITVDIDLVFSNFDKMFDKFELQSEETDSKGNPAAIYKNFRFVDLFSREAAKSTPNQGTPAEKKDDLSRLKLVIGWSYDPKLLKRINYGSSGLTIDDINSIIYALERTEYSYNLGHKNFSVNVEETGKVAVTINYVSALEKIFASREASVIYTKDENDYAINHDTITKNLDILRKLQASLDSIESDGREKISRESGGKKTELDKAEKDKIESKRKKILSKLVENNNFLHKEFLENLFQNSKIYSMSIDAEDVKKIKTLVKERDTEQKLAETLFNNGNIFDNPKVMKEVLDGLEQNSLLEILIKKQFNNLKFTVLEPQAVQKLKEKTSNDITLKNLDPKNLDDQEVKLQLEIAKNQVLSGKGNKIVNFIFLGDILDYAFGCLKQKDKIEFRTCLPVIGSFCHYDILTNRSTMMNYCDLPIALDRFKKFLFDEFIRPQIEVMRLEDFITRLFNKIVINAMEANVFGQGVRKSFGNLQTGQCTMRTIKEEGKEKEYISRKEYGDIIERKNFINSVLLRNVGNKPQKSQNGTAKPPSQIYTLRDFNYFYMFARLTDNFRGEVLNLEQRNQFGIVNIEVGADKGMVKKVNFAKQNGLHLAESAFSRQDARTNGNPLFLAGVANAEIEMFGNTFFRPGAMVFIDPSYLYKSPSISSKEAEDFGLGGFYNITKVNHEISPGKFITRASTVFHHHNTNRNNPANQIAEFNKRPPYETLDAVDAEINNIQTPKKDIQQK